MPASIDDILMHHFLDALRPGPGKRYLDVGSGAGPVARAVARTGAWVVGVDASLEAIQGAPRPWTKNALVCAGNALELPFRSRSFESVTCRHAFHHIRDLDRAFREVGRVLAPAGLAGVIDGIAPAAEKVASFLHRAYDIRDGGTHVRFMTLSKWRSLFQSAGLHLVRVEARLVMHDLDVWARKSCAGEEAMASLKAHFESAPGVVRSAMRMMPALGMPHRFATIEAVMIGRR